MALQTIPMAIVFAGLVLYTVLGGADFGAGFWQLIAGRGEWGRTLRNHAHHANAPVWEANHVWLILAITVLWTGYPTVFGSVFSTLAAPILLAAIGIVMRGLAYTLQNAAEDTRQRRYIDMTFALSSILTPFMLGTVIGAIASGRVPVGNAKGNLATSWLQPTSILCGCLAVGTGAFLAAVYLAADATRLRETRLAEAFRIRALISGAAVGALALAGLAVVDDDSPRLFNGLTSGYGLAAVIFSAAAGTASLALVALRRHNAARVGSAAAVTAILLGWAAAQRPYALPGLTVTDAAAPDSTMISLIISIALGAVILFPSLALLFRLSLGGRFDPSAAREDGLRPGPDAIRPVWSGRAAAAFLLIGLILLTLAEPAVAHIFGVLALAAAGLAAFAAVGPDEIAKDEPPTQRP